MKNFTRKNGKGKRNRQHLKKSMKVRTRQKNQEHKGWNALEGREKREEDWRARKR